MPGRRPQIERIRTLSDCAQQLNSAHDKEAGRFLGQARRRRRLQPAAAARAAARACRWPAAGGCTARVQRCARLAACCFARAGDRAATVLCHAVPRSAGLQKMAEELFALPLDEAMPILRAYGHYLK